MIVLDENVPRSQRELLESRRVRTRQVGQDVGRKGMSDEDVRVLLIQQRRPTFVTRDEDFFDRRLCHPKYCLVYLAADKYEVAGFVQRVLRHPECRTQAMRMGTVIRASHTGVSIYDHANARMRHEPWPLSA